MTETRGAISGMWQWIGLAGWLAFSFGASVGGAMFSPGSWFAALEKPAWNPPGWVFGPVWTLLYAMLGVAAWLVWRRGGFRAQRRPLTAFLVQWVLNALWTPVFFGMQRPDLAMVNIVLLWVAALVTTVLFWRADRVAGGLLVPYMLWLTFAAVLNFAIWQLNS
jgi:tryptophan-rich sensory protein